MRIIQFRVWEQGTSNLLGYEYFNTALNNGFMYTDLSELKEGETEGDLICHSEFHEPPMLKPKNFNQLFREQYTGKEDENGKEIYEGDIVTYGNYGAITEVSWNDGLTGFFPLLSINSTPIRVIGNIHENPDLIR